MFKLKKQTGPRVFSPCFSTGLIFSLFLYIFKPKYNLIIDEFIKTHDYYWQTLRHKELLRFEKMNKSKTYTKISNLTF